ncbi:MAG: hypothetical protein V4507_03350 [Verrucomicrobiota bacterium]
MNPLKILFLHPNRPDYLSDSLFHGLRKVLGSGCVDIPRYDSLYAPLHPDLRKKLRGNGFTLYGLLDEITSLTSDRFFWEKDLGSYDLVVVSDIWDHYSLVEKILKLAPEIPIAFLDGSDFQRIFPWSIKESKRFLKVIRHARRSFYFKRERHGREERFSWNNSMDFFSQSLSGWGKIYPIAFSFPEEKINIQDPHHKTKILAKHIVDKDLAMKMGVQTSYVFEKEEDYYRDISSSRFGVTSKKAGWDCLRHYEIASQGCVLCFKDLHLKSQNGAPFGLDATNTVIYSDSSHLMARLNEMSDTEYQGLHSKSVEWIFNNTTKIRAREFLRTCGFERELTSLS